jgi:hypothetical protein
VIPPAAEVVPSVPSESIDIAVAPGALAAVIAKLAANSWPGPPWPVIATLSGIWVVVSPEASNTQGALIGLP